MAAVSSSRAMHPLPVSQAASHAEEAPSLLQTFQAHVEDMRNLVLCKICIRPLYEPYTLGCGHTYCYSCLTSWFGGAPNRRKRKNCPDCRATVTLQPSPNYLLRDLVHMFISRVELLPEDETTAEHDEAKRIEAQLIEADRTTRTDGEPGLFKGAFCETRLQYHGPIRDDEDGVLRCPRCAWEMEDGECGQCGYEDDEGDFSDDEDHEGDTIDSGSVISIPSSAIDADDVASHGRFDNPFIFEQSRTTNDDFSELIRRGGEGRRARRAARQIERLNRQGRASTADTEATTSTMMDRHRNHEVYGVDSENEEEMAAFLERHPYNNSDWNRDTAEIEDEDEDMTSAIDEEDEESTTSFHRAAIVARDQGMYPPFESDLSTNGSEMGGDAETATESNSSDESIESDNDSDTPEPTPAVQRLASRPARVVIDSDDDSSSDSSSDEEEETRGENDDHNEEESDISSEGDSTPSPPRPAAVRQARVQMHRNRHAGGRGGGRGRGRPRMRG